jgi:hypothetical protein
VPDAHYGLVTGVGSACNRLTTFPLSANCATAAYLHRIGQRSWPTVAHRQHGKPRL